MLLVFIMCEVSTSIRLYGSSRFNIQPVLDDRFGSVSFQVPPKATLMHHLSSVPNARMQVLKVAFCALIIFIALFLHLLAYLSPQGVIPCIDHLRFDRSGCGPNIWKSNPTLRTSRAIIIWCFKAGRRFRYKYSVIRKIISCSLDSLLLDNSSFRSISLFFTTRISEDFCLFYSKPLDVLQKKGKQVSRPRVHSNG